MIKFSNAILTDLGEQLLVRATVEQPVNFTHLLFSSDSINQDDIKSLTEMNSKQSVPISQVELNSNHVEINTLFSNKGVNEGYYLRAIGLYANDDEGNDILIAVAIENSGECYIESENTPIGAIIQIFLKLEDTQKVNLTINPLGSASLLDIKNIKDSMNTHIEDENNPHNITKETLGLGNVENVSVNNQTPTFLEADARENIVSGEKLSSIFGKIKKWFSDLKTVAFSGSYNDLTDKPAIPTIPSSLPANGGNADTVDGKHASDFVSSTGKTANRIMVTDGNGNVTDNSLIVASELMYLQGIQENVQNAINSLRSLPHGYMIVLKSDWTTPPGNNGDTNSVRAFIDSNNPNLINLSGWYKASNGVDDIWCATVTDRARADVDGNNIKDTYAKKSELQASKVKYYFTKFAEGGETPIETTIDYQSVGFTEYPLITFTAASVSGNNYNFTILNLQKTYARVRINRLNGHGNDGDAFYASIIGI